ncbi:HalOD1 output domain-containing protein [Halobium palmae]|uniref:HalOD1 output domain-containing protein n=1 Tax=Halobium palmae TaxID=1776492 RepID=A0ABD5S043_9EURY
MNPKVRLTLDRNDPDGSLSLSIAGALGQAMGVDGADLDLCLHDYVDLTALSQLFGSGVGGSGRCGTVSFVVEEWLVVVDVARDDEIEVTVEPRVARATIDAHAARPEQSAD